MSAIQSITFRRPELFVLDKVHSYKWDQVSVSACVCHQNQQQQQPCKACAFDPIFASLDPNHAVQSVYTIHRCSVTLYLSKLAEAVLRDPAYRRAGAVDAFVWALEEGHAAGIEPDYWVYPLLGLINIVAAIYREETEEEDASVLRAIHGAYPKVVDALLGEEFSVRPIDEMRRMLIGRFMCLMMHDVQMRRRMYDPKSLAIIFRCWMHPHSSHNEARAPVREAATYMLLTEDSDSQLPLDILDRIFPVVNIPSLVSFCKSVLGNKTLLDQALMLEIDVIFRLVLHPPSPDTPQPFVPVFLQKQIHLLAITAVHRQFVRGRHPTVTKRALTSLAVFIVGILESCHAGNIVQVLSDMFKSTPMASLVSAAFRFWLMDEEKSYDNMMTTWLCIILDYVMHGLECSCAENQGCKFRTTARFSSRSDYLQTLRSSFATIAFPTLSFLENRNTGDTTRSHCILEAWKAFLVPLAISEPFARERHHLEKSCCHRACPAALRFEAPENVKRCLGCRAVYYCGPSCQRSDWATHRNECGILRQRTNDAGRPSV